MILVLLFALLLAIAIYSIGKGAASVSAPELFKTLLGSGDQRSKTVIMKIRLPRVLTAILVGASLAIAGVAMQSVLKNPLASSSTLGVSNGASFGATVAIIVFAAGMQNSTSAENAITITNPYLVTIFAFIGGIAATFIIVALSRIKQVGRQGLILAGVALSAIFSGATTLIQYFASDVQVAAVVFWTFGDLGGTNYMQILLIFVAFLIAFAYFMLNRWSYNAMENGEETAKSLGVNVNFIMYATMILASFVTAVSVSFVGIISFIGLIAPHIMRRFVGNDYRFLIPASALTGAVLLLVADTFARLIISPIILPIGAITSFVGGPMFLYILFKGAKRGV
ncbi:MAG: iron ABC transporter permease [Clostridia bacterium]|nr:iron ABC transporter permease [Clostridia bacterium]